eukprot:3180896-Alexandrium_andersonii.AAC.1
MLGVGSSSAFDFSSAAQQLAAASSAGGSAFSGQNFAVGAVRDIAARLAADDPEEEQEEDTEGGEEKGAEQDSNAGKTERPKKPSWWDRDAAVAKAERAAGQWRATAETAAGEVLKDMEALMETSNLEELHGPIQHHFGSPLSCRNTARHL